MIKIEIKKAKKLNDDCSAFVSFDFDYSVVAILRGMLDRVYHPDTKEWEIPINCIEDFKKQVAGKEIYESGKVETFKKTSDLSIPDGYEFKTIPRDYQYTGIDYGLQHPKFILGDTQGLGKTLQAINIAEILKKLKQRKNTNKFKHCLIICGLNTLKDNWRHEIEKHGHEKGYILGTRYRKTTGKRYIGDKDDKLEDLNNLPEEYFIITNIETLRSRVKVGEKFNKRKQKNEPVYEYPITDKLESLINSGVIDIIVFDEFHKCKNPDAEQTKQVLKLRPNHQIAMTGTPLVNSPLDLYVPLNWIGEENHSLYQFKKHFAVMGGFGGSQILRWKNLDQLHRKLDRVMLRRLKEDVLDLPPKIYIDEYLEMGDKQTKIYEEAMEYIMENIDKIKLHHNPLSQLLRLRQATGFTSILSSTVAESIKFDRTFELLDDFWDNDEKCIIFSNWTDIINPLYDMLSEYNPAIITGQIKDSERSLQVEKFMTKDSSRIIMGTIGAMGTGLTLTAANNVIFLDDPWHKANKDQGTDRAHRIGTTKSVNVYTLMCEGTADERINNIVEMKGNLSNFVVDGKITNSSMMVDYLLGII